MSYILLLPSVFRWRWWELRGESTLKVTTAAPLCTGDSDELIPVLNEMKGEKVAKVKVGLTKRSRDGMLVSLFLESIPSIWPQGLMPTARGNQKKPSSSSSTFSPSLRVNVLAFYWRALPEARRQLGLCHRPSRCGYCMGWDTTRSGAKPWV